MTDINTYTAAEIANLTPQSGDLVLNTDDNAVQLWNGSAWKVFNSDASPFPQQYSLSFDGVNDNVSVGTDSSLDIAGDMTLSIWAKFTNSNSSWMTTMYKGNGSSHQYNLYHRNDTGGTKNLSFQTSSGIVYALNRPVSVNTWHHIAVVVNSGVSNGTTIYVDGSTEGTGTVTVSSQPTDGFYIGNRVSGNHFEGLLDEAAIFNYALNSTQLAALRDTSGSNPVPADISNLNPVGWWRMEEGSGGSVVNTANSGTADGTINGATFVSGTGNIPG